MNVLEQKFENTLTEMGISDVLATYCDNDVEFNELAASITGNYILEMQDLDPDMVMCCGLSAISALLMIKNISKTRPDLASGLTSDFIAALNNITNIYSGNVDGSTCHKLPFYRSNIVGNA